MRTVTTQDQTPLHVKDWRPGTRRPVILQPTSIDCDGAPDALFATHKHRLSAHPLSFVRP